MKEQILKILEEIHPNVDYLSEESLIDDKVLDSFDLISLINELNEAFDIEIDVDDLEPANFNTVDAMAALVERLQDE